MKKVLFVMLAALLVISCQKKDETPGVQQQQEVSFSPIQMNPDGGLKNGNTDVICADPLLDPKFAKVILCDGFDVSTGDPINPQVFWPEVFMLGTQMYTQSIKLNPGTYYVAFFGLYTAVDGILIMATPGAGSGFAQYTNPDVGKDFTFPVTAFAKAQVNIEVLCYVPETHGYFGFNWFAIEEYVIRKQCFFGDLCIKSLDDYEGSLYAQQPGGLKIDMPAIFKIEAKVNGVPMLPVSTFSNEGWLGVGAPLCVEYKDDINQVDNYELTLSILVADGDATGGFGYVEFHTWKFKDAERIPSNNGSQTDDGVVDFVLGNCNLTNPDLQLAPYMNLPVSCTLKTGSSAPGIIPIQNGIPGYFDVSLLNIPSGYDISSMGYGVNCFNRNVKIKLNASYEMYVYNSLYPQYISGPSKDLPWDKANWLINHLDNYVPYTWGDVQQVLWKLEDPAWNMASYAAVPPGGAKALQMYNDASTFGGGYIPLPGGWAGVVFERISPPAVQCVFLRIDP